MCEHLGWTTQNMEPMESFLYLQRNHFGKRIYLLASTTVILPLSILLTWTGSMMKRSVRNSLILIIARMILFPPPLCLPAWHFGMEWYWEILWVHRLAQIHYRQFCNSKWLRSQWQDRLSGWSRCWLRGVSSIEECRNQREYRSQSLWWCTRFLY